MAPWKDEKGLVLSQERRVGGKGPKGGTDSGTCSFPLGTPLDTHAQSIFPRVQTRCLSPLRVWNKQRLLSLGLFNSSQQRGC